MLTYIIIAIICLLLSAFFSASETALTASSKPYLLHQEQKGITRAKLINNMLKNFDTTITCLLIGNNLTNVLFTSILTALFINLFGEAKLYAFSLAIVIVILITAEILPKTLAFINPTKLALWLAPFIYGIVVLITPFGKLFLLINKFITKYVLFVNKKSNNSGVFSTKDSLRGAIDMFGENTSASTQEHKEKAMLHGVLDLQELQVADIINHRKDVYSINLKSTYQDLMQKILASPYTLVPVFNADSNTVSGVLNVKSFLKDVVKNMQNNNKTADINKYIQLPYVVPESSFVLNLLESFKAKQERMAIVVDEYGSFMGILTLGDILEEITGDLSSKEQSNTKNSIVQSNNSYIVEGDLKIRDLNRKMNWKLPDEEFTTVAGLILYETGKIPNSGSSFAFHNFKFTILEKRKHQLVKIKITPLSN